ncbi:MAG: C4-dicarboxylate ABC transporter substrate-binding protein [Spirochaetes bacterium]|nr:MAG: C4-dicarboxylate ABC transporter substrate-binding protein [Spirochaetota bacterium]
MKNFIRCAVFALFVIGVTSVLWAGGAQEEKRTEEKRKTVTRYVVHATGGTAGTYFPIGGGMAELQNKYMEGVKASAEVSGASLENCRLVEKNEAQFAQANASAVYMAYYGKEPFKQELKNIRAVMSMHPSFIQFVVFKESGITTFEDLKGKKVNVGPPGGSTFVSSWDLLKTYGFKEDDINAVYLTFADAVTAMKDGNLDCAVVSSSIPNPAVTDLSVTRNIRLLEAKEEVLDKLIEKYPYYSKAKIPGGVYKGVDYEIWAMSVMNVVICNKDLEEQFVYDSLKLWFDHKDYLLDVHPIIRYMTLETAPNVPIPLHPGAERFFKEKGTL